MSSNVKINTVKVNPAVKKKILKLYQGSDGEYYETLEQLVKQEIKIVGNEYYDHTIELKFSNKKLNFDTSTLAYCCGITELGNFRINVNIKIEDLTKFFDLLVAGITNHTLIINTNGIDDSKTLETALVKCKNWTAVKKFKNSNSGNMITIWISNNP